jgi:formamidopyrimidine-DNA glycosylase
MPELPEVETVVRGLRGPLVGRTVRDAWIGRAKTVRHADPAAFTARIVGQRFQAVERRAKYILLHLDHDLLVVHLKMTGRLYVSPDDAVEPADRWVHLRLQLDGGQQLRFSDARRFGFAALVGAFSEVTTTLGPEPLEDAFTSSVFAERLAGTRRAIKAVLLDQTVLAGVGNIYADEALFRAGVHPWRATHTLSAAEIERLYHGVRGALSDGIDHEGSSINWYRKPDGTRGEMQEHFAVYDRAGVPCPTCGTPIEKIRVAQRGTHFCPVCQPLSRELEEPEPDGQRT